MVSNIVYLFGHYAIEVMVWLIIIRCFLSFIPHNPSSGVFGFIYETTEWVMGPIRKFMPQSLQFPMDFTPLIALLLLQMVLHPIVVFVAQALSF